MVSKETKHARRAAIKRGEQRRRFMVLGGGVLSTIAIGIAAFVVFAGGGGDVGDGGHVADDHANLEPAASISEAAAPQFELASSDGEPVSLDDFRGQPVAVMFMHTW